jgi:ABC-type transport system involved in cytochrome c biogenesis permease subunit
MVLYLLAFVLGCFAWVGWTKPLQRASTWLCIFTVCVHTLALVARMYISGRPPITTLYTSALFVGWVCVVIGLLMELYSKLGVANVVASFTGFIALLIGYKLTTGVVSFKGDTFTVLMAVLDTNFWLATHVTCVTAGYGATLFAGTLGIVYVVRGVLTPSLTPPIAKELGRMIYGTVCFAIFFSFFGTVLGGLWADDSWGRFWGWDPKENGALIIVLWNAVVLHAYWGRMVNERGLAVLVIVGNIVTAWSWFGVNELGVGLHSYGFTEGVLLTLADIVAILLAIIGIGMLPRKLWLSSRGEA